MIVYIDGENVVHQIVSALRSAKRIENRNDILGMDLAGMIKKLVGSEDLTIKYYTTRLKLIRTDPILEEKSREMMKWSGVWANHLIEQDIQIIKAGNMKVRDSAVCPRCGYQESIFREKGVDVRLAVDMLVDVAKDKTLIVWSADADLLPAIQVAKHMGARVKNVAHKDQLNWGLARQSGEWQTYTTRQLISFLKEDEVTNGK